MGRTPGAARTNGQIVRSHHIDAVAHHFLSGTGESVIRADGAAVRDVAIATPGTGRAAACVAAGLAAAAPVGWGSCLIEDETATWSAFSFLAGDGAVPLPAAASNDLAPGVRACWLAARAAAVPTPRHWLRWRLLGEASSATLPAWEVAAGLPAAARAAAPRFAALVWCVAADEAAHAEATASLTRLVALLAPGRLVCIVVPAAWDRRPGQWRAPARRADTGWHNPAHLQDLVRRAAVGRPVVAHVLSGLPAAAGAAALAEIAAAIAGPSDVLSAG